MKRKSVALIAHTKSRSLDHHLIQKSIIQAFSLLLLIIVLFLGCKKKKPDPPPPDPKSSEKTIQYFYFDVSDNSTQLIEDIDGVVGADTITLSFNIGVNISNLKPRIIHTGRSISPASDLAQNFNNPLFYTVTAEDGSTKKYTIKIVWLKANQKVYVGSDDGNLYAINAHTGAQWWQYTTGGPIQSSPTVQNNTVYFGSNDKYLYAVDAYNGVLKWKYFTGSLIRSESPVISNGVVFITSSNGYPDGTLYAIDANTGVLKWSKHLESPTSPTLMDGKIFTTSFGGSTYCLNEIDGSVSWAKTIGLTTTNPAAVNNRLYLQESANPAEITCVDATNGTVIWNKSCETQRTSPTISDGIVYVSTSTSVPQYAEAYDAATGAFKWRYTIIQSGSSGPSVSSAPAVLGAYVFAGFHFGDFIALNKSTGTLAWKFAPSNGSGWFSNPTAANGIVYVGAYDNSFYAIDAVTGTRKWKFTTLGPVYSGPCVVDSDGMAFHAGTSGAKN